MIKNVSLFLAPCLFGILMFCWVGNVVGWDSIWSSFAIFKGWHGIVILALSFLIAFIANYRWQQILKDEGVKVKFWPLLKHYLAGYSIMFLFPIIVMGGEIFRIYSLRKEGDFPWDKMTASIIIERILEWTINLIIIIFGVLYFIYVISTPPLELMLFFGVVFLLFLIGIIYIYVNIFKKNSIIKNVVRKFSGNVENNVLIKTEKELFEYFNLKNKYLWRGYFWSVIKAGAMLLRTWILIFFLGSNINFFSAIAILGFTYLATMVPIPAALGSHEAVQAFSFSAMNLKASVATAFTLIIRAGELVVVFVGLFFLFKIGIGFVKDKLNSKYDF